jgi:altronate hydrolase
MAIDCIKIHPADTVVIALGALAKGAMVATAGESFMVKEDVPKGHKIALRAIRQGEDIMKYGHVIGHATTAIEPGEWVHAHNMKTNLSDVIEYTYAPVASPVQGAPKAVPTFSGYKRDDGRVGTRNEIWIINTVGCVNTTAERIAKLSNERYSRGNFDGVFTFSHPFGCSQLGDDLAMTQQALSGLMRNPNAGGVLVLGLGCENNQLPQMLAHAGITNAARIRSFNAQDVADEIDEGVVKVGELFELMKNDQRVDVPVSELTLGMKCGGSDGFSGITANPLVGRITDTLTQYSGRVILTEVPEMFGAEQQLMNRAVDSTVYEGIVLLINRFKGYFTAHHQPVYENPSPGNKAGGITTLEEKSLGAIQKGGSAPVHDVLMYGEPISRQGMALLNAPGNDGVSGTAMTASGATMILFTTGRGTPLGFPVPTVKISTNSALMSNKRNWIDFDAGVLADGAATMDTVSEDLMALIIEIASGRVKAKNEINGYREIALWKEGVTL